MLTIFTIPKPFASHVGIIQRNAIQSWLQFTPACEVILCGNDAGVADVAREFGVQHLPEIACTTYGTPLLSDAFRQVYRTARHRLLCYVNADIILLSDLPEAVARIPFERFLAGGRRWNLDVRGALDLSADEWKTELAERVRVEGVLFLPSGIDYFVFPKDAMGDIPEFAVGRPGWDNWFIYRARELGWPVVDATDAITVVHQNHGYGHVPEWRGQLWEGPEADQNRALMGDPRTLFRLNDATWLLTPQGLERAHTRAHLKRFIATWPLLHPRRFAFQHRAWRVLLLLPRFVAADLTKRGLLVG